MVELTSPQFGMALHNSAPSFQNPSNVIEPEETLQPMSTKCKLRHLQYLIAVKIYNANARPPVSLSSALLGGG